MVDFNSKYTGDEVESLLDVIESKQDVIEDLDTIREGASRGATALQSIPEEYVTETELESRGFATTTDLSGKVDKQTGKGLSTEDFTTYLKNKLEELSNYDDRNLTAAVNTLRQEFDTLLNGDTSTAIETFNEIIAFLDGVSESDNLASIIASIEQQIANKQDKIADLENINEKLELINSVIDEEGYLYSNGEKVDMRFTRSLLPVGTSIPANANLNTIEYVKIGKYYCSLNADAETITNCPVKVAFSMEVFNPLGTNVDDETTKAYTYRMRVLTQYNSGQQYLQFCRTGATPGVWTYDSWYVTVRSKSTLNSNKKGSSSALGSATQGVYLDSTGTLAKMTCTLEKSVPKNAVFTDTDTKVTAVGNHYSPEEDESKALNAPDDEVVVGLKRDAAGHIVGISTATATTATNISTAPTLAEKNGQITVQVGNKTSNPLTVPYAQRADFATDLTGRVEATPEVFTYRPSAGNKSIKDDNAFIRRIKGNSVVFNQLVKNALDQSGNNGWWARQGANNVELNGSSIKLSFVSGTNSTPQISQKIPLNANHTYFLTVNIDFNVSNDAVCYLRESSDLYGDSIKTIIWAPSDGHYNAIFTPTDGYSYLMFSVYRAINDVGDSVTVSDMQIIDLTAMFGAGNEPTAEEFRALYPNSYYPYNAGELRNLSCFGIRTVGFNQWDGTTQVGYINDKTGVVTSNSSYLCTDYIRVIPNQEYYINTEQTNGRWGAWYDANKNYVAGILNYDQVYTAPANAAYVRLTIKTADSGNPDTFCINLHHTGYRDGEYERYKEVVHTLPLRQITGGQPLRKAGDVYDEITETEYIKRVGVVDLGSLAWWLSDSDKCLFACDFEYVWQDNSKAANILCAKYVTLDYASVYMESTGIAINFYAGNYYLAICDKSFTDTAALKASLSGVLLHYELAEPIVKPIETPIDFNYYVEDFGTEEAVLTENSAPFSADIIYQFNATDQVRNNTRNLHILQKKALIPSGTAAQYIRGDGSYADINADVYIADFTMVDIEIAIENAMENVGDNFSVDTDGTKLWDAIGAHKQIVIPYSNYADIGGYYIVTSAYHDGIGHIYLSIFTGHYTLNLRINKDYLLTNNKLNFNSDSSVAQSIDWWFSYMTNEEATISDESRPKTLVKRDSNGGIEVTTIDANFFRDTRGNTWTTPTASSEILTDADYVFQEQLKSGQNIKTVNNQSLLGSGNINIEGGSAVYITPFSVDDLFTGIDFALANPDSYYLLDASDALITALREGKIILIPYSQDPGYISAICATNDGESTYLTIPRGTTLIKLEIDNEDLYHDGIYLNADTISIEKISVSSEPNTIVKRSDIGGVDATAWHDDTGNTWVTPTSSQDIRDSADYFFAMKKRAEPIFENDVNIEMLSPDKIYFCRDMSELTSLTIDDFEVRDDVNEYFIHFRTGEGGTTLSMPSSVYWANGEIPEIEPSTEYELSITLYNDGGQYVTKAVLTKFAQV